MAKPLCIDLFCGLGGWADGFLAEGYDVIGFDIERHDYGTGGYPGQLVLQDVLTLDGRQFKNAAVIVASPPCQAYSYRGMPWGALWREHNTMDDDGGPPGNYRGKDPIFNDLFRACFRIAREAGLPVIVENVKRAQEFVGPAAWHFGNFYLWGDVPALMPVTLRKRKSKHQPTAETPTGTGKTSWFFGNSKGENRNYGMDGEKLRHLVQKRDGHGHTRHLTNPAEHGLKGGNGTWFNVSHGERREGNTAGNPIRGDGLKGVPGVRLRDVGFNVANAQRWREEQQNGVKCHGQQHGTEYAMTRGPVGDGIKQNGSGAEWFDVGIAKHSSRSGSRKAASAQIAKIPFLLAQHIARVFKPSPVEPSRPDAKTN